MTTIENISIDAISCAVPKQHLSLWDYAPDLLNEQTYKHMVRTAGFKSLRIAPENVTTSDLVVAAAEPLLKDVDKNNFCAVVFVTQSPDYDVPATSHILQDRLGFSNNVLCLDINEGCSGYMTGFFTAAVLAKQFNKKVFLGVGDTPTKINNPKDRGTRCIFGDAGTATIISPVESGGQEIPFDFFSYGDRYDVIINYNSAMRKIENPPNAGFTHMDGVGVMNFTLDEVYDVIENFLAERNLSKDDIDFFAFHQANKKIVNSLAAKLGVPKDKVPFTSAEIGNESSASIPLVLTYLAENNLPMNKICCCGFGVGLSIGICTADFSKTKFHGVLEFE